jgi:RNase H-fold protein (predicted Holliday junction resolvase)
LRALGIDYGLKRIGLAVSDPTGTIATPLETLQRRAGKRPPLTRLEQLGRDLSVERQERERKERVDAAAAQLILQAWLDQPEIAR